ncbi:MAG: dehydrogenase [Lentisphaerae bacterium RIFOXYA12_FULL_48_11]|nr:MAG: dehydrogenase [Lentisphaerae bacterium RIFOXYA12_FULL_48_11]
MIIKNRITRCDSVCSRRQFLKKTAMAAGAIAVPYYIPGSALGKGGAVTPSERIVLGAIGIGPRGRYVLDNMVSETDVQFVAICDVQRSRREAVKAMADSKYGNNDCVMYRDFRELLARKDIDAVLVATGDHWHTLASIMAAKAGKDVYSEKPCGITIEQCCVLADTMYRYGRVFQAGTQRRSVPNFQFAVNLARSGKLGKLHTLHASIYRPHVRHDWLPAEPEPSRDEVDWDMWLGPCPWRPYNPAYVKGGWRKHYDFDSGGTLLDWGAHTLDLCQWANKADGTVPIEYEPTPESVICRYKNGVKVVCDFLDDPFGNRDPKYRTSTGTCPIRFVGDEGWIETGDSGEIIVNPESLRSSRNIQRAIGTAPGGHVREFFDCMRTRQQPSAGPHIMKYSHIACHAAALAWQLNRKLKFDPVKEKFIGDDEANRYCSRAMREPWHI